MKYSITILQAEVTRFENAIEYIETGAEEKYLSKGEIEKDLKNYKAQITELKADIKKL